MKRYVRSNTIVVRERRWNDFLDEIETETGLKVDSAYRRRRKGENYIDLIDEDGNIYEAEITEYFDGEYEFRSENMHQV